MQGFLLIPIHLHCISILFSVGIILAFVFTAVFPGVILPHKKDCRKNKCQNYTQSACLLGNDKIRHRKGQAHTEPGNTHRTPPVYTHQRTIKRKYSNHKHQKDTAGRIVKIAFFVKSVPDDTKQYQIHNKTKGDHSIFNFFT